MVIVTSSVDAVHGALLIVQRNTFAPTARPVTPELGEEGVVTVPEPLINVQVPVPVVGVLPAKVAVVTLHKVWSGPALDVVGVPLTVIVTSSVEGVQGALAMVQRNTLAPTPNPVKPEVGEEGVVIVPEPEILVQVPVPVVGVLPASVAVVAHIVWSGPAAEVVGLATLVITTSSFEVLHPIVQRNVFAPTPNPVTPEVGLFGEVMVPVPLTRVQVPLPVVGVLPAKVAVEAQIV